MLQFGYILACLFRECNPFSTIQKNSQTIHSWLQNIGGTAWIFQRKHKIWGQRCAKAQRAATGICPQREKCPPASLAKKARGEPLGPFEPALLDGLGSLVNQSLGFLQAQAGDLPLTTLMTLILLAPALFRTTSNSVFSSSAAGAAAAGAATATAAGAAAETPNSSSRALTSSESSRTVRDLTSSIRLVTFLRHDKIPHKI